MNDLQLFAQKVKALKEKVSALRILVVDDEELIRKKTGDFMESFFDKVDCAEDGEAALKMFNKDVSYDTVITDLQMPNMTGEELIKKIRAINPNLFIVVMTGTPDVNDELIEGCDICLSKPVGLDDMLKMMEMLVEKKGL